MGWKSGKCLSAGTSLECHSFFFFFFFSSFFSSSSSELLLLLLLSESESLLESLLLESGRGNESQKISKKNHTILSLLRTKKRSRTSGGFVLLGLLGRFLWKLSLPLHHCGSAIPLHIPGTSDNEQKSSHGTSRSRLLVS